VRKATLVSLLFIRNSTLKYDICLRNKAKLNLSFQDQQLLLVQAFSCGPVKKKTPPLSCVTVPVNFCNMRDGWIAFDDQSRCRPQSQLVSLIVQFQFKARIANHEQGRVNPAAII